MRNTKYIIKPTTQFKKDYKLAMKRGLDIKLLDEVITTLAMGLSLPEKNRDHALTGNWIGHRECHIMPDWLLVYRFDCRRIGCFLYGGFNIELIIEIHLLHSNGKLILTPTTIPNTIINFQSPDS